jgi:hypothetical protein
VPRVRSFGAGKPNFVYFWAGVGGDGRTSGYHLVQAGVSIGVSASNAYSIYAFWEVVWAPHGNIGPRNLNLSRINPGDTIYVYVSSNYVGDPNVDYFFVLDESTNSYGAYRTAGYISDSATGECIGERPGNPPSSNYLANFGTMWFYGCNISTNSAGKGVGHWPHNYWVAVGSRQLVYVGAINNGSNYPLTWLWGN